MFSFSSSWIILPSGYWFSLKLTGFSYFQVVPFLSAAFLSNGSLLLCRTQIRGGSTQPLAEHGISRLLGRLFKRAELRPRYTGHDLRRTFCPMVKEASGDKLLAMRLARDKIPGTNDRYINADPVKAGETPTKIGDLVVEAGESRTSDNQLQWRSVFPQIMGHTLA